MRVKDKHSRWWRTSALLGAVVVALVILAPVVWALATSLKSRVDALASPPVLLANPTWDNYREVFQSQRFRVPLVNSLEIGAFSTLLCLLAGLPAGYAFSMKGANFARVAFVSLLGIRMAPPMVLALPIFVIFSRLGLNTTTLPVILMHAAVNLPIAVWLSKVFFDRLPKRLYEASLLDGDRPWGAFVRQIIPVAAPAIMAVGLVCFLLSWNEFFFASVLTSYEGRPVTVVVPSLITPHGTYWGVVTAITMISIIPPVGLAWLGPRLLVLLKGKDSAFREERR